MGKALQFVMEFSSIVDNDLQASIQELSMADTSRESDTGVLFDRSQPAPLWKTTCTSWPGPPDWISA